MIKKQKCPYLFVIEYDESPPNVDPAWLHALLFKMIIEFKTCTQYDVRVLKNKVPKRFLNKSVYARTMGLICYNKDPENPYYYLKPRPQSFEISTMRGQLIYSKLIFKKYPDESSFLQQRVVNILQAEASDEWMKLAQARNLFQFMENTKLPEPKINLRDILTEKLYKEYNVKQMRRNLRIKLEIKIQQQIKQQREEKRKRMLNQFKEGLQIKVNEKLKEFEKIQKQKVFLLSSLAIWIITRVVKEKERLTRIKLKKEQMLEAINLYIMQLYNPKLIECKVKQQQKDQILIRMRIAIQKKVDLKRMQIDEKFRQYCIMIDILKIYFKQKVSKFLEVILFNNQIKDKYSHMSKDQAYKKMSVHEMLMDEDVPPDLIVQKLDQIKVNYLSPCQDFTQANEIQKVSNKDQKDVLKTHESHDKEDNPVKQIKSKKKISRNPIKIDKSNEVNSNTFFSDNQIASPTYSNSNTKQRKSKRFHESETKFTGKIQRRQKPTTAHGKKKPPLMLSSKNVKNLFNKSENKLLSQESEQINSQFSKNIEFHPKVSEDETDEILQDNENESLNEELNDSIIEDDLKDSHETEQQNEASGILDEQSEQSKNYFDMFNLLTNHKWKYKLPNEELIELDDTESVLINQQMNLVAMQLFKQKMMWQKLRIELQNKEAVELVLQNVFDITVQSQFILQRYRYQKPNTMYSIDIITKEMTYFWPEKKQDIILKLIENSNFSNQKTKNSKQNESLLDTRPSIKYNFQTWGWLGNQYLESKDFQLPSWDEIKGHIIKEQMAKIKEEVLYKQKCKGIYSKIEMDQQVEEMMAQKLIQWNDIFQHIDLPSDTTIQIQDFEFQDPKSKTVRAIFYLYSLESFLYGRLNWAARSKRISCIQNLGPFAAILSRALSESGKFREYHLKTNQKVLKLYRGTVLTEEQLNSQYKQGSLLNWGGYISTSQNFEQSLQFACRKNQDPSLISIMFIIELVQGTEAGYSFVMNEPCYTKYPEEEEILLDDGLPFKVFKVERDEVLMFPKFKGRKITRVHMRSILPTCLMHDKEIKLKTNCNLKEFMINNGKPLSNKKYQWLCHFQTEMRDFADDQSFMLEQRNFNLITTKLTYKASVSENIKDSDGLYFERVKWQKDHRSKQSRKYIGINCFRIFSYRKYGNDDCSHEHLVKRYLQFNKNQGLSKKLNKLLSNKLMVASFEPDPLMASIWCLDLLKSDTQTAQYIIQYVEQNENEDSSDFDDESKSDWSDVQFNPLYYLAVNRSENNYKLKMLQKNNQANYIYLTQKREDAAIWSWHHDPDFLGQHRVEIKLLEVTKNVCQDYWVYKMHHFTTSNVFKQPLIKFYGDNTFSFVQNYNSELIRKTSNLSDLQLEIAKSYCPSVRIYSGKWQIDQRSELGIQEQIVLSLTFSDENASDQDKGKVRLLLDSLQGNSHKLFVQPSNLIIEHSDSFRMVCHQRLVHFDDQEYLENRALSQCQIFNGEYRRKAISKLLPKGCKINGYLFCIKQGENENFVQRFQKACRGKKTLILIRGQHNKVFGAYTDQFWTANVSAPKFGQRNSFIFADQDDNQSYSKEESHQNFIKYKVKEGYEEVFSSDTYGPNFYDLKLSGPDQESTLDCLANHYKVPASLVSDDYPADYRNKISFTYKIMEVFSVDTRKQLLLNADMIVLQALRKAKSIQQKRCKSGHFICSNHKHKH